MILVNHRFHICKFIYFLKFIYNPHINISSAFSVISDMCRLVKNLSHLTCIFPAEIKQGNAMPPSFSSHTASILFIVYLVPWFLHFCTFCWQFCHFKWLPISVLSVVLVFLRARSPWCALWGKHICLGKRHSGMSYSAVSRKFNVK